MKTKKMTKMRLLTSLYTLLIIFVADSASAATKEQVDDFNEVYRLYTHAVEEGDTKGILKSAQKVIGPGSVIFTEKPKNLAALYVNLGNAYFQNKEASSAIGAYKDALDVYEKNESDFVSDIASTHLDIARAHLIMPRKSIDARFIEAQRSINRSLKIVERHYGNPSLHYGEMAYAAAKLLSLSYENGVWSKKAEFYYSQALDNYQKTYGKDHQNVGVLDYELANYNLAAYYKLNHSDKLDLASDFFEKSYNIFIKSDLNNDEKSYWLSKSYTGLMATNALQGNTDKLTELCQKIFALQPNAILHSTGELQKISDFFPIKRVEPIYPTKAASQGIEGRVIVEFTVSNLGIPTDIKVVSGEEVGYFSASSIKAVSQWRFRPKCDENGISAVKGVQTELTFKIAR